MTFTYPTLFYILATETIGGFCFWKLDFLKKIAPKLGIRSDRATNVLLVLYWLTIPITIHRLIAMMWML